MEKSTGYVYNKIEFAKQFKGVIATMKKCLACLLCILISLVSAAEAGSFHPLPIDLSGGAKPDATVKSSDKVYEDPTIRVERYHVSGSEWITSFSYAFITIKDPSQLRTAPADGKTFASRYTAPVKKIARNVNAVLAINGDYCASFSGDKKKNFILRQGTVYRETVEPSLDMLLIDEDGDFHILTRDENLEEADLTEIDGKKIINAFQFGPALVIDGEPVSDEELLDLTHSPVNARPHGNEQRMCIAQIGPLQYMVLSTLRSHLVKMRDLAMSLADVKTAYILDGGESSQMVFLGALVNKNTSSPRPITDIIYFASAWFEDDETADQQ